MRVSLMCITLLWLVSPAVAASAEEDEQDRVYLQCLINRKVDPPVIPPEDSAFCMQEAGIEDLGDAARKDKGSAWRNCLIRKATELDDGVSPVSDISKAIIQYCPSEWKEYVATLAMYPKAKRAMASGLAQYGVNEGVQAVLLIRRTKREMQNSAQGNKK